MRFAISEVGSQGQVNKHGEIMRRLLPLAGLFLVASCRNAVPPQPGIVEGIAKGKTRIIDLGHALNPQNPYFPDPGFEPFKYATFATIEKDGFLAGKFSTAEHMGTHLDAPNHFVAGQPSLDKLPLERLFAPAVVIDVRGKSSVNPDYLLTAADITAWEQAHGRVPENAVVMMYNGWDERWPNTEKYNNADKAGTLHFPGFSGEAAKLLVEDRNIAGLAIDTLSVDYGMSKDFPVHHISHGKGKYHLENVAHLGAMPAAGAWIVVAPIKIENGTGGPARIFALVGSTS